MQMPSLSLFTGSLLLLVAVSFGLWIETAAAIVAERDSHSHAHAHDHHHQHDDKEPHAHRLDGGSGGDNAALHATSALNHRRGTYRLVAIEFGATGTQDDVGRPICDAVRVVPVFSAAGHSGPRVVHDALPTPVYPLPVTWKQKNNTMERSSSRPTEQIHGQEKENGTENKAFSMEHPLWLHDAFPTAALDHYGYATAHPAVVGRRTAAPTITSSSTAVTEQQKQEHRMMVLRYELHPSHASSSSLLVGHLFPDPRIFASPDDAPPEDDRGEVVEKESKKGRLTLAVADGPVTRTFRVPTYVRWIDISCSDVTNKAPRHRQPAGSKHATKNGMSRDDHYEPLYSVRLALPEPDQSDDDEPTPAASRHTSQNDQAYRDFHLRYDQVVRASAPSTSSSSPLKNASQSVPWAHLNASTASQRSFSAQGAGDGIDVAVLNAPGPASRSANIVFLSDGWLAADKDAFHAKAKRIFGLMNAIGTPSSNPNVQSMHNSVPHNRYAGFWNVYAVFQPSNVRGCGENGIALDTNLRCRRPLDMPRGIQCDAELSLALAAVVPVNIRGDPDRTVLVVISNTNGYGGTGLYQRRYIHLGAFYNGEDLVNGNPIFTEEKYLSLVNHEIGHAFGKLFDEYDFGFSEPTARTVANCKAPQTNPTPWQDWITLFNDPSTATTYRGAITGVDSSTNKFLFGVASSPVQVCGYSNYFKPNDHCMMHRLNDYFMCPVCREASYKEILSLSRFELQWPRFPDEGQVYTIPQTTNTSGQLSATTTGLVLMLPASLTAANQFEVTWRDTDNSIIPGVSGDVNCPACVLLTPAILARYPLNTAVNVTATIVDRTRFVTPATATQLSASMTTTARFTIKVVPTVDDAMNTEHATAVFMQNTAKANGFGFYSAFAGKLAYVDCRATGGCLNTTNVTLAEYVQPPPVASFLGAYDVWVIYVVVIIGVLFVLIWAAATHHFYSKGRTVVRPIFQTDFTMIVKIIRWIMRFAAIMFMVGAIGTMIVSTYFYTKTSAIGKVIIVAGLILSLGLYVMAFVGFWAIAMRSKRLVFINTIVLLTGLAVLATITGIAVAVGSDIETNDSFWTQKLNEGWIKLVENAPENACAIEEMMSCSGFLFPCFQAPSTLYCPEGCERTNQQYSTPCRGRFQEYIASGYGTVVAVLAVALTMMSFAIIFNNIYYWNLAKMKRTINDMNNTRVYNRAIKNNVSVTAVESNKALHILKSLDAKSISKLVKEFYRMDTDGNGEIDRQEMTYFFRRALCHKITQSELDELFAVADLDGNGAISLDEFLVIFNHKKPTEEECPEIYKYKRLMEARKAKAAHGGGGNPFGVFGGGTEMTSNDDGGDESGVSYVGGSHHSGNGGGGAKRKSLLGSIGNTLGSFIANRRRSSAGGDMSKDASFLASSMNGDISATGSMINSPTHGREKTEAELEREMAIRKRAAEHLQKCGLIDESDIAAEKEVEAELQRVRSRNQLSATLAAARSTIDKDPSATATASAKPQNSAKRPPGLMQQESALQTAAAAKRAAAATTASAAAPAATATPPSADGVELTPNISPAIRPLQQTRYDPNNDSFLLAAMPSPVAKKAADTTKKPTAGRSGGGASPLMNLLDDVDRVQPAGTRGGGGNARGGPHNIVTIDESSL